LSTRTVNIFPRNGWSVDWYSSCGISGALSNESITCGMEALLRDASIHRASGTHIPDRDARAPDQRAWQCRPVRRNDRAAHRDRSRIPMCLEAPAGFEPAVRVLQTRALPLG